MSHDVERLAKVLYEGMPCPLGRWEDLSDAVRGTWFAIARSAMKAGVTLPTPPRAPPLEAAARMIREARHIGGISDEETARQVITAAVGALSEEDVRAVGRAYAYPDCDDGVVEARGVLLVRLTEGGAT